MSVTTNQKIIDWTIDTAHSTFEFAVRQMKVSTIKGAFSGVTGEIRFDPDDVSSSTVQVEIDMSTIDTHNAGRDDHLRGETFFDVENYPTATFASKRVRPNADGTFQVIGDLTMRGVTKEVEFHTVFAGLQLTPNDVYRGAFVARATIDRTDFGLSEGSPLPGGGYSHSKEVKLAMFTSVKPKEE